MVNEEYMKAKTKGSDEDNQQQPKDRGWVENVTKHENVDTKEWNMLEVCQKIEPGWGDKKWSNWPLPTLQQSKLIIIDHP